MIEFFRVQVRVSSPGHCLYVLLIRAHTRLWIKCLEAGAWVCKIGLDSTVVFLSIFHRHLYALGATPVLLPFTTLLWLCCV